MGACSAKEAPHPHRDTEETRRRDLAAAPRSCRDEGALCKQARRVHATPGKHRGLQPPTTAQLHEVRRVRREAVMKGGRDVLDEQAVAAGARTGSAVWSTRPASPTRLATGSAGEEVLELPGATAVTHRPHNRLQESQPRAVPPHHGWLVVHFPVQARTNHDFGKMWRWGPRGEALLLTSRGRWLG